jgi:hypothetical protein
MVSVEASPKVVLSWTVRFPAMVVAPVVVEPERIKLLAYISPSASTRNLILPPTAAEMRLPSATELAGLIYTVPSAPLEVPEGQEGLKT